MNERTTNPFMQFDFNIADNESKSLCFSNPIKTIIAQNINEVNGCLDEIQQATDDGFYTAGYISYEATQAFFPELSMKVNNKMPLLWFGVFKEPLKVNKRAANQDYFIGDWKMNLTKKAYEEKFQQIMAMMKADFIEQINFTTKFKASFTGDAYSYYHQLKQAQQANFNAYLEIDHFNILSASPELFFALRNQTITVKPMKGTIHRGNTFQEDLANKVWLQTSEKNQHENQLTTHLMKRELTSITQADTLKVSHAFAVEKYPTVYQMTSTITGETLPNIAIADVFHALFPCSSIAGTPKQSALELIFQAETEAREVYCGAIGYITPEKEAIFNVPIRTVLIDQANETAEYGAGGAITEQSNSKEEYNEVITKTEVLHLKREPVELLETFGLYNGQFIVYNYHLERLTNSADYFDININLSLIEEKLTHYTLEYPIGKWIVRLIVSADGNFTTEIKPLLHVTCYQVALAIQPIDKTETLFYHKTTNRSIYEKYQPKEHQLFDVLLWNEQQEVTEFTIGNMVVELDGKLLTPPVSCGLLPGTFRQQLLDNGTIIEQIIHLDDLKNCSTIWLINSVRKWIEVELVK